MDNFIIQFIERRQEGEYIRRDTAMLLIRDEFALSNKEAEEMIKALDAFNRVEGHKWNTVFVKVNDLMSLISSLVEDSADTIEEVEEEEDTTVRLLPAPKEEESLLTQEVIDDIEANREGELIDHDVAWEILKKHELNTAILDRCEVIKFGEFEWYASINEFKEKIDAHKIDPNAPMEVKKGMFNHCKTLKELKAEYRRASKYYHPDSNGTAEQFQFVRD